MRGAKDAQHHQNFTLLAATSSMLQYLCLLYPTSEDEVASADSLAPAFAVALARLYTLMMLEGAEWSPLLMLSSSPIGRLVVFYNHPLILGHRGDSPGTLHKIVQQHLSTLQTLVVKFDTVEQLGRDVAGFADQADW